MLQPFGFLIAELVAFVIGVAPFVLILFIIGRVLNGRWPGDWNMRHSDENSHTCPDSRCRCSNPTFARFCRRCGHRLA